MPNMMDLGAFSGIGQAANLQGLQGLMSQDQATQGREVSIPQCTRQVKGADGEMSTCILHSCSWTGVFGAC